jgi:hypothetical protein
MNHLVVERSSDKDYSDRRTSGKMRRRLRHSGVYALAACNLTMCADARTQGAYPRVFHRLRLDRRIATTQPIPTPTALLGRKLP